MKFLKKRKADKIAKLKTRVLELEETNGRLERKVYYYKLKYGEVKLPQKRRMMKVMGKTTTKPPMRLTDDPGPH
jgi:hypothetical protein